jgi:holin-like protein
LRIEVGWSSVGEENSRMIDHLRGFSIVLLFQLIGWSLHRAGVPIPGGVLGLLEFYLALSSGLVKLAWVERTAGLLLRHMVLLFVPLTVGLMDLGPVLSKQALAIGVSLVVSLLAVLFTTGLLGKRLLPPEPVLPGLPIANATSKEAGR